MNSVKFTLFIRVILIIFALVTTGCAKSPQHDSTPTEQRSEPTDQGVTAPKAKEGSDDMERLD